MSNPPVAKLALEPMFPEKTAIEWQALAERGMRGAAFETLTHMTEDGLNRGPLFDADARPQAIVRLDGEPAPFLEGRAWHICAMVEDEDHGYANQQLLKDLTGGASAVRFGNTTISRRADLKRVLEGVYLNLVPVVFAPGSAAAPFAPGTEELYDTPVTLGLDPLGERPSIPEQWTPFTIAAAAIHDDGGDDTLELAVFAATLAEALRRHGPTIAGNIAVELACGTDAHLVAVKLRAARRLALAIFQAFDIKTGGLPLHAISSQRMMQSADAWTNLLRTQSAGLGAVWGGADFIALRPFTDTPPEHALGKPTPFASRLARNQQLLMMEESHLGQVRDPAYGSYFHERLTEDLAQAAWAEFQNIEASGGIEAFRANGALQSRIEAAIETRADRGDPILGLTLYPAEDVRKPEVRT